MVEILGVLLSLKLLELSFWMIWKRDREKTKNMFLFLGLKPPMTKSLSLLIKEWFLRSVVVDLLHLRTILSKVVDGAFFFFLAKRKGVEASFMMN